jgi:hypothetical protein
MVSRSRTPRPGAARNFFNEQLKEYNEDFDRSLRASPLTSSGFGDR